MPINASASHHPDILTGPFGSEAQRLHRTSTATLFHERQSDNIRRILCAFRSAGATVGVTPTYGANQRGLSAEPEFSETHTYWNQQAARLAAEEFDGLPLYGSVATLPDSSGKDDDALAGIRGFSSIALERHAPQLFALRRAGVERFLLEAGRYVDEATGLIQAAVRVGAKEVICSFEAPGGRVPDPAYRHLTFEQVLDLLATVARGKLSVGVGVNCISADDAIRAVEAEKDSTFAAVYPNSAAIADDAVSKRFLQLSQQSRSGPEDEEFQRLRRVLETSNRAWKTLRGVTRDARVRIIGICCGGTPDELAALCAV